MTSTTTMFSANVNINTDFVKNYHKIEFTENSNKIGVKFEENKILSLNILKLEQNNFMIKNSSILENEYLIFDESNFYNLKFSYGFFELCTTIPLLNKSKIDIKSAKFISNNLVLQTSFYFLNDFSYDDYYFNYQSLNFTKKGIINYVDYQYKNFNLVSEFALSEFGIYASVKALITYNNLKVFFTTKNIKEKYLYGFIFENSFAKVEVVDKIYNLSIYGGQGVKRNFEITSDIKLPIENDIIESIIYLSTYHEIDYDVYLSKKINQIYRIRNKIKYKDNNIECSLRFGEKISAYLIINNLKINYYDHKIGFDIWFQNKQKNSIFKFDFSLGGDFKISYSYSL